MLNIGLEKGRLVSRKENWSRERKVDLKERSLVSREEDWSLGKKIGL